MVTLKFKTFIHQNIQIVMVKLVQIFSLLLFISNLSAQELVSVTLKGSRTKSQIFSSLPSPDIRNGAKFYTVLYTSADAKGAKDTLSGLMVIPDNLSFVYPTLVYQHGTSDCKICIPSRYGSSGGEEGQLGIIGAGLGYVSFLPDYVGMGNGRGFQTYVHAATIQRATHDMILAAQSWLAQNNVRTNDQFFITGYSQGGYASMAYHKYREENNLPVTAAAHLSGPYSLSTVMRELITGDKAYFFPAYLPNTALGFQEVYGDVYGQLSDIFKPEFIPDIQAYYDGSITLTTLNGRLISKLTAQFGSSVAKNMLVPAYLDNIVNNQNARINQILAENDIYKWAAVSPTRIFYCMGDDQVPFMNSVVARDTMVALGSANLAATDVNPSANHGTCFNPAILATIFFFKTYQQILSSSETVLQEDMILVTPNPAFDIVEISFPGEVRNISLLDMQGREILHKTGTFFEKAGMDISQVLKGPYLIRLTTDRNQVIYKKVVKW